MNDATYRAPTPRVLYIHDDLSEPVERTHGSGSRAARLVSDLLEMVRRDPRRVVVLTLEEQVTRLLALGSHAPFSVALSIGRAGERVARDLHARTGWFPNLRRVDITREEDGRGGYTLVSLTPEPLADTLRALQPDLSVVPGGSSSTVVPEALPSSVAPGAPSSTVAPQAPPSSVPPAAAPSAVAIGAPEPSRSVAVVDDTLFSGLTMRTVLGALPPAVLARTWVFCLRGVAETLPSIRALCPISVGFAARGRILEDVSFINASGLVRRGSIRRAGRPPLAFFERPEWMEAWFPGYAAEVIARCRAIHALLEPQNPASVSQPENPTCGSHPVRQQSSEGA
jgi:hypothetical protein